MKQKSIAGIGFATVVAALLLMVTYTACEMEVNEASRPVFFVEPYINTQPASISYYPGEYTAPPELSVQINDWQGSDGTLSYQWFTFENIGAYVKDGGTPIDGATTNVYTPSADQIKTAPTSRNYFYVEISNRNGSAVDKKEGKVRSNVAIISFNEGDETTKQPIPLLEEQPIDAQARFASQSFNPMRVRVDTTGEGAKKEVNDENLVYQWYQVTNKDTIDVNGRPTSKKIDNEIAEWYSPDLTKLAVGDHYFYLEIKHTAGLNPDGTETYPARAVIEYSVPTKITVLPGLRAASPEITVQPKSATYLSTQPASQIQDLSVTATSLAGELTYQWFSNTKLSTSDGNVQEIAGATSRTLPVANRSEKFFFVKVTNTMDPSEVVAGGQLSDTVTSYAVNVRKVTTRNDDGNSRLTLKPEIKYQYIRGYGGMEVAWANFPETYPSETELMYNPDKLGYNILRIMLPLFHVNIDLSMEQMIRERRPNYYENVKIVNKYGGYVAAAPWSPPKEWKSNNSINGGGYLQHEYYKQYAAYLKSFAQHMYNRGAPIYVISIQNEPNYTAGYDGCEWHDYEMRDFFKEVGHFTDGVRGFGGGKSIPFVLTMNGESANNPDINHPAIDDAEAYRNIDMFARHVYGDRRVNLWQTRSQVRKTFADDTGKDVWMTEHNINSANATAYPNDSKWNYLWRFMNDVDLVMRLNNENAFVWWASKRFYSMIGDGQDVGKTAEGVALARGWGLSHYSKYTIGSTRIGYDLEGNFNNGTAISYSRDSNNRDENNNNVNGDPSNSQGKLDMDNTTPRITAYAWFEDDKTTVREISMVLWTPTTPSKSGGVNMGWIKIKMPDGFVIGSATGIKSYSNDGESSNVYHEPCDDDVLTIDDTRGYAYVNLGSSQVISVKFTK